jgi:hypothetical protein
MIKVGSTLIAAAAATSIATVQPTPVALWEKSPAKNGTEASMQQKYVCFGEVHALVTTLVVVVVVAVVVVVGARKSCPESCRFPTIKILVESYRECLPEKSVRKSVPGKKFVSLFENLNEIFGVEHFLTVFFKSVPPVSTAFWNTFGNISVPFPKCSSGKHCPKEVQVQSIRSLLV